MLKVLNDAPGYLKAMFQGPQGSGKSFTAAKLAVHVHKMFGSKKPIAFFDTEGGSDYLNDFLREATGMDPIRDKSRAFSDLMDDAKQCADGAADILIVDSITHVWRELADGYMAAENRRLKFPKVRMDIDDIMRVKTLWQPWPDFYITSGLHIIVCGREGNAWETEENEETGKRSAIAVGKKMKVEGEFGFEGSLSVAMSARQETEGFVKRKGSKKSERRERSITNVATIIKDRFDEINGEVFENPTGESFNPHLVRLHPELHVGVDVRVKSDARIESGDGGFGLEKRQRVIYCEEIQGELVAKWPGQTAADKAAKTDAIYRLFNTRSWTQVEALDSKTLRAGLATLRAELHPVEPPADVITETAAQPEPAQPDA